MDKHSKRSASIFRYPVLIAFTLFFAGLFLLDLVTPDRAYSELENTTLSQRPSPVSYTHLPVPGPRCGGFCFLFFGTVK